MSTEFLTAIYQTLKQVPAGRIVNYGRLALAAGYPGYARAVGKALHALDEQYPDVAWWRVVNREGRISTNCPEHTALEQRQRLEAEGIEFDQRGYISWQRFGWLETSELEF
ncbi:MGMT family protein [Herpetosiphon gulosus]|uniref:DNA base-flipping protein n=1 Tax=Herpetosiphon gulosus TaxID=1973496 RepID=A0ABP9X597_9CHLR